MSGQSMADVLAGHWSASTHSDQEPFVDKCDGCGTVLRAWGDKTSMPDSLAAHQAAALSAAGFGPVQEAKADAWDEGKAATFNDPVGIAFGDVANPYRKDQP